MGLVGIFSNRFSDSPFRLNYKGYFLIISVVRCSENQMWRELFRLKIESKRNALGNIALV